MARGETRGRCASGARDAPAPWRGASPGSPPCDSICTTSNPPRERRPRGIRTRRAMRSRAARASDCRKAPSGVHLGSARQRLGVKSRNILGRHPPPPPPPQTDAPWRPPPGARRRRRSSRPSVAMYRRRYAPVNPRIYRSWEVRSTPSGRPARFFAAAAAVATSHRRVPPAAFPSPRPHLLTRVDDSHRPPRTYAHQSRRALLL